MKTIGQLIQEKNLELDTIDPVERRDLIMVQQ
jgi:hypothetical protein